MKYRYIGIEGMVNLGNNRQLKLKYGDIIESDSKLTVNFELIEDTKISSDVAFINHEKKKKKRIKKKEDNIEENQEKGGQE